VYDHISDKVLEGPKQYGSLAEYTAVVEKLVAVKPKNIDFAQAAGLPLAIETAHEGLRGQASPPASPSSCWVEPME
jgi:2-methylene-furan-3-one reductase